MTFSTRLPAVLAAALFATAAHGSGFYFGDNGTKAMMQGGAFTAQADDLTAIMYNPAGLAEQPGSSFVIDAALLNHEVSFTRYDNGFDPANPPRALANTVNNTGGLFFLPFVGAGHGFQLGSRRLTVALGLYGPPSVGRYQYPVPSYAKGLDSAGRPTYLENPRKFAPNRYQLINNDIIILYPSLSLGFQVHRRFQVGVSLQYVYSTFAFRQTLYADAGLTRPTRQLEEEPTYDSEVQVALTGKPNFTAIFGAMVKPLDSLTIGASIRPTVPLRANGKLTLNLGETATAINSKVVGDQAELAITLPIELRVGVRFQPIKRLGVNLDWVYMGWQSVGELLLTPQEVTLQVGSAAPKPVEPFHIPKRWRHTNSIRLGASFDVISLLTVHAGFLYETGASPVEQTGIDFAHFDRFFLSGGLTAHLWKFDVLAGIAYTPATSRAVTNSLVAAGRDDPSSPPIIVGAGVYGSGGWIATFGIRGRFGGAPAAVEPAAPVEPTAPVAPENPVAPEVSPPADAPAAEPAPAPAS